MGGTAGGIVSTGGRLLAGTVPGIVLRTVPRAVWSGTVSTEGRLRTGTVPGTVLRTVLRAVWLGIVWPVGTVSGE